MWLHAIVLATLSMTGLSFRSSKSLDKSAKDTLGRVIVIWWQGLGLLNWPASSEIDDGDLEKGHGHTSIIGNVLIVRRR